MFLLQTIFHISHLQTVNSILPQSSRQESFTTMAPPAADVDLAVRPADPQVKALTKETSGSSITGPLKYSGSLDGYKHFDVTPVIGEEFPELQLTEILSDDNKLRDLAILGMLYSPIFIMSLDTQ